MKVDSETVGLRLLIIGLIVLKTLDVVYSLSLIFQYIVFNEIQYDYCYTSVIIVSQLITKVVLL